MVCNLRALGWAAGCRPNGQVGRSTWTNGIVPAEFLEETCSGQSVHNHNWTCPNHYPVQASESYGGSQWFIFSLEFLHLFLDLTRKGKDS